MNVDQATAEVMARGFDYLPASRILIMLNAAKNTFEDQWAWPWLDQTVTGAAPLSVDRLKHVYYVQDTGRDTELTSLDVRSLAQDGTPLDQPGSPIHWWLNGPTGPTETTTINTWPVGPATLEARVQAASPELALPADTPLIPVRHHPLWLDYAVVRGYHDSDNFTGAQMLQADIQMRTQLLVIQYETRNRQHSEPNAIRAYSEDD